MPVWNSFLASSRLSGRKSAPSLYTREAMEAAEEAAREKAYNLPDSDWKVCVVQNQYESPLMQTTLLILLL